MMALCGEPRGVKDARALRIDLERNPEAPSLARAAVTGFFEKRAIDAATLGTVTLLVSELVSNAVVHSDAPDTSGVLLCARLLEKNGVRVEVTDRGKGFTPVPRDPERQGGGYGLYLVDREATNWGVEHKDGTRVWFEISSGQAS